LGDQGIDKKISAWGFSTSSSRMDSNYSWQGSAVGTCDHAVYVENSLPIFKPYECDVKTYPRYRCKFFIYAYQNIKPSSLNVSHFVHGTTSSDCSLPKSKNKYAYDVPSTMQLKLACFSVLCKSKLCVWNHEVRMEMAATVWAKHLNTY
jgi:hypothetical protein